MGQCREIRCEDIAATVARLCVQACTLLPEPVRELHTLEALCAAQLRFCEAIRLPEKHPKEERI